MRLLNIFPLDASIECVFKDQGWEVVTLEYPKSKPEIEDSSYKCYPPDHFQCIWAHPREHKSRKHDLEQADQFCIALLDLCKYFGCPYFLESPASSYLKLRPFMKDIPSHDIRYCAYDHTYVKNMRVWTNTAWSPIATIGLTPGYVHNCEIIKGSQLPFSNEKVVTLSAPPVSLIKEIAHYVFPKPKRLLELFSGTGSVGKVFKELGWSVISLDINPKANASITEDILTWDYTTFPSNYFDCIWASPMCTQYSRARTKAKTPRNLEEADALVQRALLICDYFGCPYFLENPQTGLLKTRSFMQGLPFRDVTYCSYGFKYQKRTRIWTNTIWTPDRELCNKETCPAVVDGRHIQTAQQGPGKAGQGRMPNDNNKLEELYSIPPDLVKEIVFFLE